MPLPVRPLLPRQHCPHLPRPARTLCCGQFACLPPPAPHSNVFFPPGLQLSCSLSAIGSHDVPSACTLVRLCCVRCLPLLSFHLLTVFFYPDHTLTPARLFNPLCLRIWSQPLAQSRPLSGGPNVSPASSPRSPNSILRAHAVLSLRFSTLQPLFRFRLCRFTARAVPARPPTRFLNRYRHCELLHQKRGLAGMYPS